MKKSSVVSVISALSVSTAIALAASACGSSKSGTPPTYGAGCPPTAPKASDPCPDESQSSIIYGDVVCEYGTDPVSDCNTVAQCIFSKSPMDPMDKWYITSPDPKSCPGKGSNALTTGTGTGCPSVRPLLGTECPLEKDDAGDPFITPICKYCGLPGTNVVACYGGRWTYGQDMCP